MEPKRIMLQESKNYDSILLSESVCNPVTMDMLHGAGDLIHIEDVKALQDIHTLDYVMGFKLHKNNKVI